MRLLRRRYQAPWRIGPSGILGGRTIKPLGYGLSRPAEMSRARWRASIDQMIRDMT